MSYIAHVVVHAVDPSGAVNAMQIGYGWPITELNEPRGLAVRFAPGAIRGQALHKGDLVVVDASALLYVNNALVELQKCKVSLVIRGWSGRGGKKA